MKQNWHIFLIIITLLCVKTNANTAERPYSMWMAQSEMTRVPQSYLLDFSTRPKWSYVMGIELEAMLDTYQKYGDQRIMDYLQMYVDTMIDRNGNIRGYNYSDFNLDNIRTGHFLARMYQLHPDAKTLVAMQTLMRQLDNQPRTETDGVYWHKAIYSYQVWLDGIFMGLPFRVLAASMLLPADSAKAIYDDAVDQIKVTYSRTLDTTTGLNRHAWDETHEMFWANPTTGQSQHCWGRAQGWFTMALVELLDALPDDYNRRDELTTILTRDFDAIIKWQDKETGLWYQVMDSPTRPGNYLEATCSSMFAYSLMRASRRGYVDMKYLDAGKRAYAGIVKRFIRHDADSLISLTTCCSVAGLGPGLSDKVLKAAPTVKENRRRDGSYAYYLSEPIRDNDAKGVGPFIWASLEIEEESEQGEVSRRQTRTKVYDETIDPMQQLDQAIEKAGKEHKYVLGQVGGNWCPWCLLFADFAKNDADISQFIADNFIYIHINYSGDHKNPEVMKRLNNPGRFGYPVFVILDGNGKLIHTQNSAYLEEGNSYSKEKVLNFLKAWTSDAINNIR